MPSCYGESVDKDTTDWPSLASYQGRMVGFHSEMTGSSGYTRAVVLVVLT